MRSFYYANYRLLMDDAILEKFPSGFSEFTVPATFTHTFTVRMGNADELARRYKNAESSPMVCDAGNYSIHKADNGWEFVLPGSVSSAKTLLTVSHDYSEMVAYTNDGTYFEPVIQAVLPQCFPFQWSVRIACEAGMALRNGIPLHASLVEHESEGIVFLGPSGMGKSTQAKLWERCLGARMISGDRPALRILDNVWYGNGMPWDGKDRLFHQRKVKLRAVIALEQADHNEIRRLTQQEAMSVLLKQTSSPMWDQTATGLLLENMARLAATIPFYRLKNLANEDSVRLTYDAVMKDRT